MAQGFYPGSVKLVGIFCEALKRHAEEFDAKDCDCEGGGIGRKLDTKKKKKKKNLKR